LTDTADFVRYLRLMAATPRDGHDAEWLDFVTKALGMPGCYVPAAQAVIDQGRWRRVATPEHNPIGYIKTATLHEAVRMGLAMNRYNPNEPWVKTKDLEPARAVVQRPAEDALRFKPFDTRIGCVPLQIPKGKSYDSVIEYWTQRALNDEGGCGISTDMRRIPGWLSGSAGRGVHWRRVATHAVQKPRMILAVTAVLVMRFDHGIGLPAAMARAATPDGAKAIAAAWKWIDRNRATRIAPLFKMAEPPDVEASSSESKRPSMAFIPPSDVLWRLSIQSRRSMIT
jgi:hypothetical protein